MTASHPFETTGGRTQVRIRRAGAGDAECIAAILADSFAEFVSLYTPEGFAATTPTAEQVRQRITEGPTWEASVDNGAVGTVAAVLKAHGLYVRGMAVLPSARGQYVGQSLLQTVHSFAEERGCSRLFLSTTPFLTAAIRLYQGYGFRRTADGPHDLFGTPLFTMSKELRGQESGVRCQESGLERFRRVES